jgi:hypothetical protein
MRSKKGFINFPPAWRVKLEPIEPNKFGFGFVELTDRARTHVGSATREMIQERITYIREWAKQMISSEGKDPSNYQDIIRQAKMTENLTADRAYCAASVLERLDDVERELGEVERGPGQVRPERVEVEREMDESERNALASLRNSVHKAIYYALMLSTDVHVLTVVDNESGIAQQAALPESRKSASAQNSRSFDHQKWNRAAVWEPGLSKEKVAERVREKLKLPQKAATIAKRLKKPRTTERAHLTP